MCHVSRSVGPALRWATLALIAACAAAATPQAGTQDAEEYTIGPLDVLEIQVFDQPDLSGRYTVGTDGSFAFPLIGRISTRQRTARVLEELLREHLAAGYLRDPRVSVAVTEYRSRRVFVLGEVRQPGAYNLTATMTVVELLALAGGNTDLASEDAVVVRGGALPGAAAPGGDGAETLRVNLDALVRGNVSENVALRHGDTLFVPRTEVAYVFGEVRSPGRYPIRNNTTVLQMLSLAGGTTIFGGLGGIRIVRTIGGEQVEIPAQLGDLIQPDDVVRVPNRFF